MKASIIAIPNHQISQRAADNCIRSSIALKNDFDISLFEAITPERVEGFLNKFKINWNYPWEGEIYDFKSGLKKRAYRTANKNARIACALSHYSLWQRCAHEGIPHMILEHDAKFIRRFDTEIVKRAPMDIFGINDPAFATRKSKEYRDKIKASNSEFMFIPTIDDHTTPQGLAGNSAYIIKPSGAKKMIDLVEEHGLWPNDALMCKQLVPKLGVVTTFYTAVQGIPSTTSD